MKSLLSNFVKMADIWEGVLIVSPDAASDIGTKLMYGDIVIYTNGSRTKNAQDFQRALLAPSKKKEITMTLIRNGSQMDIVIPTEEETSESP